MIAQSRKDADSYITIPCAFSDGGAVFTLDLHQYADRMVDVDTIWDLSLSIPGNLTVTGEAHRLRLGRFGDEIMQRKHIHVYPKRTVTTAEGRSVTFNPYYTDSNYLSLGLKSAS
ncbi:hypothetical protein ABZ826_17060 [Streptomyces sp. NPDC047515]|uniref:hypothetical protein n=1 Tax=Streptomyces sp. NPDC047515 TaxID=3155380 RepID=UPI0033D6C39D